MLCIVYCLFYIELDVMLHVVSSLYCHFYVDLDVVICSVLSAEYRARCNRARRDSQLNIELDVIELGGQSAVYRARCYRTRWTVSCI